MADLEYQDMASQYGLPRRISRLTCFVLVLISLFFSTLALEAQIRWQSQTTEPATRTAHLQSQGKTGLQPVLDMSSQGILTRLEAMSSQVTSYLQSVFYHTAGRHTFDVYRTSAYELQQMLEAGTTTSTTLVEIYLEQIEKHNLNGMQLRAMISTASKEDVLSQAHALDEERQSSGSRGPFHGIPVIVKVCSQRFDMPRFTVNRTHTTRLVSDWTPLVGAWLYVAAKHTKMPLSSQRCDD